MEYKVQIRPRGNGQRLLKMLNKRLPALRQQFLTFGEAQLSDGVIIVEFDLDEERALQWCIQRFFILAGLDLNVVGSGSNIQKVLKRARKLNGKFVQDDPETAADEAWEGGKAPPKKKRAAPKKKAPAKKKAAPKKKAPSKK